MVHRAQFDGDAGGPDRPFRSAETRHASYHMKRRKLRHHNNLVN
jgi:hypothetical protein